MHGTQLSSTTTGLLTASKSPEMKFIGGFS